MRSYVYPYLASSILLAMTGMPSVAVAQDGQILGDIIVTAQKREQSLSDVGLTITAASSETLLERGVRDISDLAKITPGFTTTSNGNQPIYILRGIGLYDYSIGAAPAVAVYVDEIARPFPITQKGVNLDLERVEVLKGPQGTLFGQSSTGGAINYIAAKPTDHFEAGFNISYERFGLVDADGFLSGPLAEGLKGRLAVRAANGGAWQYSASRPYDKNGKQDFIQGRIILDWEPSDTVRFSLNVNGVRDKSDTTQPQFMYNDLNWEPAPTSVNPYAQVDPVRYAALTDPSSAGYNSSLLTRKSMVYARLHGLPFAPGATVLPTDPAAAALYLAGPNGDGTGICTGNNDSCIRTAEWGVNSRTDSDEGYYQFALRTEVDVSDSVTITSLTSYQKAKTDRYYGGPTAAIGYDMRMFGDVRNFSEELRLNGKAGNLTWLAGVSYDWAKVVDNGQYMYRDVSSLEVFPGLRFVSQIQAQRQTIKTYAAFANAEYQITPELNFHAGLRYTDNKRSSTSCIYDLGPDQTLSKTFGTSVITPGVGYVDMQSALGLPQEGHVIIPPGGCITMNNMLDPSDPGYLRPTITPYPLQLNEDNLSFRVGVDYKFPSGTLLYASVARGYKAGVITNLAPAFASAFIPAVAERVVAYEAGIKTPLFGRLAQLNASTFYYDYKNKQLRTTVLDPIFGGQETMINVPSSYIWGLEAELNTQPIEGLSISASGTYLKSKVNKRFDTWAGGEIFNSANYKGDFEGSILPFTPKFTGVIDGQYDFAVTEKVNIFLGGSVFYQSKDNVTFHTDIVRGDDFVRRGHTLVDTRVGLASPDGAWRAAFYVRNLTNQFHEVSVARSTDHVSRLVGTPRIFGVQLTMRTR